MSRFERITECYDNYISFYGWFRGSDYNNTGRSGKLSFFQTKWAPILPPYVIRYQTKYRKQRMLAWNLIVSPRVDFDTFWFLPPVVDGTTGNLKILSSGKYSTGNIKRKYKQELTAKFSNYTILKLALKSNIGLWNPKIKYF